MIILSICFWRITAFTSFCTESPEIAKLVKKSTVGKKNNWRSGRSSIPSVCPNYIFCNYFSNIWIYSMEFKLFTFFDYFKIFRGLTKSWNWSSQIFMSIHGLYKRKLFLALRICVFILLSLSVLQLSDRRYSLYFGKPCYTGTVVLQSYQIFWSRTNKTKLLL